MEPSLRPSASAIPVASTAAEPAPSGVKGRGRRWETPPAGSPVRLRLDLQRRARSNLRRHVVRAATRFVVLVLADLLSFYVMRALVRGVRDQSLVGDWIASLAQSVLPAGILNGWQFASALFVSLVLLGCYGAGDQRRDPRRLFMAAALATALPLWMAIWIRGPSVVAVEFALTTVLVWAGLVADRLSVDRLVARVRGPEQSAARTLFVGSAQECAAVARMPAFEGRSDFRPVGFVDTQQPAAIHALGHFAELAQVIHDSGAEAVVVCGELSTGRLADVANAALAAECKLLTLPCGMDIPGVEPEIVWRRGQPLMELTAPTLKGWQFAVKRVVDIVGATLGVLLAAPIMAVVAVAVKLDSPGPVFFRQERVGTGGRRFGVFKFRTMVQGASDAAHRELVTRMLAGDVEHTARVGKGSARVYKLLGDQRITPVGRLLRRTSLDELPQLFNVLRGDMSLVGPRPPIAYEIEGYAQWQYDRLRVRPGITGLWQVSGRNLLTYGQMCELDVEYVRNWSLWLDFVILLKTIPVVLFNSGSAA